MYGENPCIVILKFVYVDLSSQLTVLRAQIPKPDAISKNFITFVLNSITLFFFGLLMFCLHLFYQELLLTVSIKDFYRVEERDNRPVLCVP